MAPMQAPESRFAFVVVVSRRARQLQTGSRALIDTSKLRKPTRIAREELVKGLLDYELPVLPLSPDEKEGKRRKG
ncbi:MAG: DNA-directed RNA polymerase subunit omega [Acidobacteria bacterium]|nr:DNA-directed RNA polymerase subunit omega [Acidobacteriota bacterium]MBI3662529.1 DNA-directed RNA polymerase subunit omega [Acidobacteriota bacterium]